MNTAVEMNQSYDNNVLEFVYETLPLRIFDVNGNHWFSAKDVCRILALDDVSKACSRLDDDEKLVRTMFVSGQNRSVTMISEAGVYSLIMTSRKLEAKAFKRWVTHEVLPTLRRQGFYVVGQPKEEPKSQIDLIIMMTDNVGKLAQYTKELEARVDEHDETLNELDEKVITLDNRVRDMDAADITGDERQQLVNLVAEYARRWGIAHNKAWREFRVRWNIAFHENIGNRMTWHKRHYGYKHLTAPEYLEQMGRLKDGLRIVWKMLDRRDA